MEIFAETERLILREIIPSDKEGMFELDSDPQVHLYLGNNPVKDMRRVKEIIQYIRQQYMDYGIGRWAIIEKETNSFIGWTGLKFNTEVVNNRTNYYDVGYRLIKRYWGRGFATESAIPAVDYGFEKLKLTEIIGIADVRNNASRKVLEKIGLHYVGKFDLEGDQHDWLQISRDSWLLNHFDDLITNPY